MEHIRIAINNGSYKEVFNRGDIISTQDNTPKRGMMFINVKEVNHYDDGDFYTDVYRVYSLKAYKPSEQTRNFRIAWGEKAVHYEYAGYIDKEGYHAGSDKNVSVMSFEKFSEVSYI